MIRVGSLAIVLSRWRGSTNVLGAPHDHPIIVRARDGSLLLTSRRDRRSPTGRPRHAIYLGRSPDGGQTFEDVAELWWPASVAQLAISDVPYAEPHFQRACFVGEAAKHLNRDPRGRDTGVGP